MGVSYRLRSHGNDLLRVAATRGINPTGRSIALAAGLDPGALNKVLAGRQTPAASTIAALTRTLGVTVEDLFEVVDDDDRYAVGA
jgi:transcriptional regulator with XRE-family HTH domain